MSELIIVFILLLPIFIVIFILNRSKKRQENKEQEQLSHYLNPLLRQTGLSAAYQAKLVYEHIVVDEEKETLLIVNSKDAAFSHELHRLTDIKSLSVQTIKQNVMEAGRPKPEIITAQIGVELTLQTTDEKRFLVFYCHREHNVSQMAEFTTTATRLCERLKKRKVVEPAVE